MSLLTSPLGLRDSPHHLRMVITFILISFVGIFSTALVLSTALSRYLVTQLIERDGLVSGEFLNSVVQVEDAEAYFVGQTEGGPSPDIEEFLKHVARMPDVFRANVYNAAGTILWSSDEGLAGKSFPDNEELQLALKGIMHPELDVVDRGDKDEHVDFPSDVTEFIEYYIPITAGPDSRVVGAVEVYKAPAPLLATLRRVRSFTWLGALVAASALFGGLGVVVGYSIRILQRQEARLIESERLAVVGEMASAVAHGLRNPLAAIRSCAELTLEDDIPDSSRGAMHDITDQVDRLESWIRSFLIRGRQDPKRLTNHTSLDQVIHRCIETFAPQLVKRGITLDIAEETGTPIVLAQSSEVEQVLNTIISNSIEAMQTGGQLGISWSLRADAMAEIQITDTGPGITPAMRERVFTPFATGKSSGLGVGLALGRRIVERLGGTLDLTNRASSGVRVILTIPSSG